MFNNKNIFITGGTGSFRQVFIKNLYKKYRPKRVIVYSRDELKQFEMANKFSDVKKYPKLRFYIGDIRDKDRLGQALTNVDYVIHAAALKHVPVAETNPMECIKTNILGAQNLIECSIDNGVKKVIALSTDKAADPINLYGVSKLAADKLFVAGNFLSLNKKTKTSFSIVRYGNVINSRGSVIPFFKTLVENKSKFLPITHPEMTRFFITLNAGVEFVMKSFHRMVGGEIFIPKLPSIKIIDLAKAIAPTLKTKIVGLRPGEKIHEILCPRDSSYLTLNFKDHYIIKPTILLSKKHTYETNQLKEKGKKVEKSFKYDSENNKYFLKLNQIKKLID